MNTNTNIIYNSLIISSKELAKNNISNKKAINNAKKLSEKEKKNIPKNNKIFSINNSKILSECMTFANTKYKKKIYSSFPSKKIFFYLKLIEKYISIQREIMTNYKYNTNISSTDYEKIIKELYDKIYICIIIIIKKYKQILDRFGVKLKDILRVITRNNNLPFCHRLNELISSSFHLLLFYYFTNNKKNNNKNQKSHKLQNLNIKLNSKYIKKKFMSFIILPRALTSKGEIVRPQATIQEIDNSKKINEKINNNISFLIDNVPNTYKNIDDKFITAFLLKLNNIDSLIKKDGFVNLIKKDGYTFIDIDYNSVENYVFR